MTRMVIARCLLSTAVMLGLCAMHVLAAASSLTSAAFSAPAAALPAAPAAAAAVVPAAVAAAPPASGPGMAGTTHLGGGESAGAPESRVGMPPTGVGHSSAHGGGHGGGHGGAPALHQVVAGEHEHGSVSDCVLFLGAGIALLVLLVAAAAARALRPSYWMLTGWPQVLMACTPWRGPPAWHWPRIHLCVIRV